MPSSPSAGSNASQRVQFADTHASQGPQEAETTRLRRLAGFWRWLLVAFTALTILLCINQQFTLRFFVGYTQLNTEYFYLLIVLMLPFTFLIFPGSERAPLDRVPWYDITLFVATIGAANLSKSNMYRVRVVLEGSRSRRWKSIRTTMSN